MMLWIDDIRQPPQDFTHWAKTSEEAIELLKSNHFEVASFDHDLGGDDTTRKVVLWLCENDTHWPSICIVHSQNPIGVTWLRGMIERYQV